jgi:hypothetical protein
MTQIEQDLARVLELLDRSSASVMGLSPWRQTVWNEFQSAACAFIGDHAEAIKSALADQRRLREAPVGNFLIEWVSPALCEAVVRADLPSAANHKLWQRMIEGRRVAIVPLDQEGE